MLNDPRNKHYIAISQIILLEGFSFFSYLKPLVSVVLIHHCYIFGYFQQIWTLFLDIDCPASLSESFERCNTAVFTTRIAEMELERRLSYLESRKSRLPPTLMDVFTASLLQSIVDGEFKVCTSTLGSCKY